MIGEGGFAKKIPYLQSPRHPARLLTQPPSSKGQVSTCPRLARKWIDDELVILSNKTMI